MEKSSEKVLGADNQQERLDELWIVGFVDGEGCFHVALNKLQKMTVGWQVLPEFRIVQHQRDVLLLKRIQNYFGFGSVQRNHGDRQEFRVRGMENLEKLISFFNKHPLQSIKRYDFEIFCQLFFRPIQNTLRNFNRRQVAAQMRIRVDNNILCFHHVCDFFYVLDIF